MNITTTTSAHWRAAPEAAQVIGLEAVAHAVELVSQRRATSVQLTIEFTAEFTQLEEDKGEPTQALRNLQPAH